MKDGDEKNSRLGKLDTSLPSFNASETGDHVASPHMMASSSTPALLTEFSDLNAEAMVDRHIHSHHHVADMHHGARIASPSTSPSSIDDNDSGYSHAGPVFPMPNPVYTQMSMPERPNSAPSPHHLERVSGTLLRLVGDHYMCATCGRELRTIGDQLMVETDLRHTFSSANLSDLPIRFQHG